MGKSVKNHSKKIKDALRAHVREVLGEEGPCLALWDEGDGNAGYAIRIDGTVLALGDYQHLEIGKQGTLEDLKRAELGQVLGGLMTVDEAPAELGHPLHPQLVEWLHGRGARFDPSDGIEGPAPHACQRTVLPNPLPDIPQAAPGKKQRPG